MAHLPICAKPQINVPVEDCEYWLVPVNNVSEITDLNRNTAWITPEGYFYVYDGRDLVQINDHSNLKVKWGNIIGDITEQEDLRKLLLNYVKGVKLNGAKLVMNKDQEIELVLPTEIRRNGQKLPLTNGIVDVNVPILAVKKNGVPLEISDYAVNIDLTEYALATSIPTKVSDLDNDAGYVNSAQVQALIPTKVSQLANDANYQNATQVESKIESYKYQTEQQVRDIVTAYGYQTLAQVKQTVESYGYQTAKQVEDKILSYGYQNAQQVETAITSKGYQTLSQVKTTIESYGYQTAQQVQSAIANAGHITYKKVTTLPATGETNVIYMVPNTNTSGTNIYDEYMWIDGKWEVMGTTKATMDGYLPLTGGTLSGQLSAPKFVGPLQGNASSATNDASGQPINSTYIKALAANGRTITYTKGDGSIGTITTQDTTYGPFGKATAEANGTNGLVPAPAKGQQGLYLRADGTWATPTNTTYGLATTSANGLLRQLSGNTTQFMRGDGSWATPPNTTYGNASETAGGLMSAEDKKKLDGIASGANNYSLPLASNTARGGVKVGYAANGRNYPVQLANEQMYVNVPWTDTNTTYGLASTSANGLLLKLSGNTGQFMRGDGAWATPPNTTYDLASTSANGLMPKLSGNASQYLKGDGAWGTPPNTTYSAGSQLSLSGTQFALNGACTTITDWNAAVTNGWYMGYNITNTPVANAWIMGYVTTHNANYVIQEVFQFTASTDAYAVPKYMRVRMNGTWGAWRNVTVSKAVPSNAVFTDTTYGVATQSANGLMSAADKKKLDSMWPVGAIYLNTNGTNPGTFLGGTWQQFGQGRCLVGVGTGNDGSNSMSFTSLSSGGSYKHQHGYGLRYGEYFGATNNLTLETTSTSGSVSWSLPVRSGVTSAVHTNYQSSATGNMDAYSVYASTRQNSDLSVPYIAVYLWRRTA